MLATFQLLLLKVAGSSRMLDIEDPYTRGLYRPQNVESGVIPLELIQAKMLTGCWAKMGSVLPCLQLMLKLNAEVMLKHLEMFDYSLTSFGTSDSFAGFLKCWNYVNLANYFEGMFQEEYHEGVLLEIQDHF